MSGKRHAHNLLAILRSYQSRAKAKVAEACNVNTFAAFQLFSHQIGKGAKDIFYFNRLGATLLRQLLDKFPVSH